jgi:hypothetical protein
LHNQSSPPVCHQSRDRRPLILAQHSPLAGERAQLMLRLDTKHRPITHADHSTCLTGSADTSPSRSARTRTPPPTAKPPHISRGARSASSAADGVPHSAIRARPQLARAPRRSPVPPALATLTVRPRPSRYTVLNMWMFTASQDLVVRPRPYEAAHADLAARYPSYGVIAELLIDSILGAGMGCAGGLAVGET